MLKGDIEIMDGRITYICPKKSRDNIIPLQKSWFCGFISIINIVTLDKFLNLYKL